MNQTFENHSREDLEAELLRLRKQRETDAQRRRREAVFESAVDFAIVVTDHQGIITDWNSAAERIMGWKVDEMIGQTAERFFTPEDRAHGRVAKEMNAALTFGRANDERWHLRKDGSRFWASGGMFLLRDDSGAEQGFFKIMRDRTEQRETGALCARAKSVCAHFWTRSKRRSRSLR